MKAPRFLHRFAASALLAAAIVAPAGASAILPGFDLFESQPGTSADLSSLGAGCPAAVPLEGVPLVPSSLGNTDTIVQRLAGSGSPFDPPGDMVTVPIELVALHLVSVSPVDLTCVAGPPAADLHLTINKAGVIGGLPQPDAVAPSIGSMEIRHDLGPTPMDDFGGSFDSCFGEAAEPGHPGCMTLGVPGGGVFADAIFTVPGGDPSDPADVVSSSAAAKVALSSTGGTWLHVPAPGYPLDPAFPAGAFFVQTLPHIGPHPVEPAKVVEATKVDSLTNVGGASGDVDADGVADPGDTVSYTVEITGLGDAVDVTLDDTVDPNSTLVGTSVQITPIAFDDLYELTGTMLNVPAATGVLLNDVDPDHSTAPGTNTDLTAVSLDVTGTAGTVSNFMPDGSFDYETAMGFSGLDSFQYTARDEDNLDSVVTGVVVIDVKNTPPTATDDSYASLGNTLLEVTLDHAGAASVDNTTVTQPSVIGETTTPKTFRSVFENDTDAEDTDKNDLTAAVVGGTVSAGAVVNMFDDGTFEYTPPVDFTGADTFDYTVTDTGGLMDTGTVTINVSSVIWYVDKDNAGTADGRSATPFTSLAPLDAGGAADGSDGDGDTIFVFDESTGNTSGGILLETNQILHGNGVALDPLGFEYAGGGDLVAVGTAPTIEDTAGDVIVLASGNTVRGIDIAATNGRAIFGNASAGATIDEVGTSGTGSGTGVRFENATGTIAVSDLDVSSSTDAGIDIQGGIATFTFDDASSITNTAAPAFNVNGGTAEVTYSGSITQGNAFPTVSITGHSNGAGTGITFQTGTISATNGTGLQFSNADGTYDFDGPTTLNGGGTNDTGIDILGGSAGTFTFANTSITNPSGTALNIDNSTAAVTWSGGAGISKNNAGAAVNVTNHSTGAVNIGVNINGSGAGAGTGLQFSNADGTYNFNTMTGTTTLNGGDAGIDILGGSNGSFTFGANTTITNPTGIGFQIDTSTSGNVTYNGTISQANAASAVRINAKTGGTVTLSGAIIANTSTATGINLTSNTGGTFTFSGGLDIDTTSGTGFNATGGTVNVDSSTTSTTVDTGTGIGVNIGAGIGGTGVTFDTVNVNGSSNGILLANTGAGTFNVAAGTIQNTTSRGFDAANVDGTVNIAATLENNGGRTVEIDSSSAGAFTFSAAIDENAQGIDISSNTAGATFTFSGGLDIDTTGANTGFDAASGGTLQICADSTCNGAGTARVNTIDTTIGTGTAISIDTVTIGAAGVTFRSIDVNAGGTAKSGINLDTTGSGPFTVTGTGTTDGSGGTIQDVVEDGVRLFDTDGLVTLKNMVIEDIGNTSMAAPGHHGIDGQVVDGGLTLDNVDILRVTDSAIHGEAGGGGSTTWVGLSVTNSKFENSNRFHVGGVGDGGATDEAMITIEGISGTVVINNNDFALGPGFVNLLTASSGSVDITVQSNTFNEGRKDLAGVPSIGSSGVRVNTRGTIDADIRIGGDPLLAASAKGNTFVNTGTDASIFIGGFSAGDNADVDLTVAHNMITVTDHTSPTGLCLTLATCAFDFPNGGIGVESRGSGSFEAWISYNTLVEPQNSGGLSTGALRVDVSGDDTEVVVRNNDIRDAWDGTLFIRADDADGNGARGFLEIKDNIYNAGTGMIGEPGSGDDLDRFGLANSTAPFFPSRYQVRNGAVLDLTIDTEDMVLHETGFAPNDGLGSHDLLINGDAVTGGSISTFNVLIKNSTGPYVIRGFRLRNDDHGVDGSDSSLNLSSGASGAAAASNISSAQAQTVLNGNTNAGTADVQFTGTHIVLTTPTLPAVTPP